MKILLVEDDIHLQLLAEMCLVRANRQTVVCASDGIMALDLAVRERPDLILLDVMMPRMDGYETCLKLKGNPTTASIPVIFLTARTQDEEMALGFAAGGIGYLRKPFDPMLLMKNIEEVLSKKKKSSEA